MKNNGYCLRLNKQKRYSDNNTFELVVHEKDLIFNFYLIQSKYILYCFASGIVQSSFL